MLQEIPPVVRLQQQKTNEGCKQCSYWGLLHWVYLQIFSSIVLFRSPKRSYSYNRHIISMKLRGFLQTPQYIMEEYNGSSVPQYTAYPLIR